MHSQVKFYQYNDYQNKKFADYYWGSIHEVEDSNYLLTCVYTQFVPSFHYGSFITKISNAGNEIQKNELIATGYPDLEVNESCKINSNYYFVGHSTGFGLDSFGLVAGSYNQALELDQFKLIHINPTYDTSYWGVDMIRSNSDNNLVLLAREEDRVPDPPNTWNYTGGATHLYKLDTNFNIIWHTEWGYNKWWGVNPNKVIEMENGNFLVIGYYRVPGTLFQSEFKAMIAIVDPNGIIIKDEAFGDPENNFALADVKKLPNNKFVACGQYSPMPPHNAVPNYSLLFYLDEEGNYNTFHTYYTGLNQYFDNIVLKNNRIYASGFMRGGTPDSVLRPHAMLMALTLEGDSLWQRRYNPINKNIDHYIWGMTACSDGGILMAGTRWGDVQDSSIYSADGLIIKVDSFGCLVPGCQLTATEEIPKESLHLKAYPNPAKDLINFTIGSPEGGKIHCRIVDITGREWMHWVSYGMEEVQRDVSHLAGGVYFTEVIQNQRRATLMWVKE